jgi:glutamate dehydrogenase
MLPVLQNMGVQVVDERPYELRREDGTRWWIYDFGLRIDPAQVEERTPEQQLRQRTLFQEAFRAIWRGDAESDRFNSLVLTGGLSWRQAALLRAYSRYLRQAGVPFDQGDVEAALLDHTDVATALVTLFETRFDLAKPDEVRDRAVESQLAELATMIDEVTSLDADRILRSLLALIRATLRTNYNVRDSDGQPRPYLALKLDPAQVLDLPDPRPKFEIFVYSPRVEGVHLRFGPVARGGLRWSDRR